ncbi:SgcJ/EcaC family oxidoreductase [bacterium]|nr:SgcJ/EcaC family oxidoreductase [bacterium]
MDDHRRRALAVNDATYAAWNAHDPDAVAAVFAEDAVVREVGTGQEARGRAAVRARAAALLTAFPDLTLERVELLIDGDRHADRWVLRGTHRGELLGIPPTGRRVRIDGATFTRLGADGLVVEDLHFADTLGLMAQLTG